MAWKRLPAVYGGSVPALATGVDGSLFAGTLAGLFHRNHEGGGWAAPADGPAPRAILSFATHPADESRVFAGSSDGLYRSLDAGKTWKRMLASPPVTALTVAGNGVVLAATDGDGIFRSGDDGLGWEPVNAGLLDLDVLSLAAAPGFSESGIAFAGTASGLYRSVNGGRSWRGSDVIGDRELAITALAISPRFDSDRTMIAGTEDQGLFSSADAGATWARVDDVGDGTVNAAVFGQDSMAAGLGDRVFVSTGGRSFEPAPLLPAPVLALAFTPDALLAGLAGLGVRALGRDRWDDFNEGLASVRAVRMARFGSSLAIVAADGSLHVLAEGAWRSAPGIDGSPATDIAGSDGDLWAVAGGRVHVARGDAGTWREIAMPDGLMASAIAVTAPGTAVIGCADGTVALATGGSVSIVGTCNGGQVRRVSAAAGWIVAATGEDGVATVWRAQAGGPDFDRLMDFEGAAGLLLSAGEHGRGAVVAAAHGSRIAVADLSAGEPELMLADIGPATVRDLVVQGSSIYAATDAGLLESMGGNVTFVLDRAPDAPTSLATLSVSRDATHVADSAGGVWVRARQGT